VLGTLRSPVTATIALIVGLTAASNSTGNDTKPEQGPTTTESDDSVTVTSDSDAWGGPSCKAEWFRQIGIGFRAGSSFREAATGGDYPAGYFVGPELQLAVFSYAVHRAVIGAGYIHLGEERSKGTYQIRVESRYQRVDLFAGYGLVWKLLTAGLRVGTSLTIVNVETTYGEPGWEVVGMGDEAELVMYDPIDPQTNEETGVSAGFNVGLGIGLALGHYLFGIDDLVELRAQSDYLRRGERDEFTVGGLLVFWPTRLIR
jgi:hypothetical protein